MAELSTIDKVLVIIRNTQDGDLLSPFHLKLTEDAANGFLNEKGLAVLDELYEQVANGSYQKPYHHGVEFMTQDHDGYIYFKDKHVEHYSFWWTYSLDAKNSLLRLQQYCLYLESKGVEPSSAKAMFIGFDNDFAEYKKQKLDSLLSGNAAVSFTEVTAKTADGNKEVTFCLSGNADEQAVKMSDDYKDFIERNEKRVCEPGKHIFEAHAYIYGSLSALGEARPASGEEMTLLLCCSDYLKENALLAESAYFQFNSRDNAAEQDFEVDFDESFDLSEQEDEYDEEI